MITKTYDNISKEKFYKLYLSLANVLQPSNKLTDREIELLVEFLLLEGDKFKHARFAARAKKKVSEALIEKYDRKLTPQYMILMLKNLESKGYIEKDEDGIKYFNRKHQLVLNKILTNEDFSEVVFKIKVEK